MKATTQSVSGTATRRLMNEIARWQDAIGEFSAAPLTENIFEWHFTLIGPIDTPYEGGVYHGVLQLPHNYPQFGPSAIVFLTPNGRFETGKPICASVTSYHPELWNSSWTISTLLRALRLFMVDSQEDTLHAIHASDDEKRRLARESHQFRCQTCLFNASVFVSQQSEMEGNRTPVETSKTERTEGDAENDPATVQKQEQMDGAMQNEIETNSAEVDAQKATASLQLKSLEDALKMVVLPSFWTTCYICLSTIDEQSETVQLGCPAPSPSYGKIKHRFHLRCLYDWMRSEQSLDVRSSCPVCRTPLSSEMVHSMTRDYEKTDSLHITIFIEMASSKVFIEQKAGSYRLVQLASTPAQSKAIAEKGGVPVLAKLLSSQDSETVRHSITALKNLMMHRPNISLIHEHCHKKLSQIIASECAHTRLMGLVIIKKITEKNGISWVGDDLLYIIQKAAISPLSEQIKQESQAILDLLSRKQVPDALNQVVQTISQLKDKQERPDVERLSLLHGHLKASAFIRKLASEECLVDILVSRMDYEDLQSLEVIAKCLLELVRYEPNRSSVLDSGFLELALSNMGRISDGIASCVYGIARHCFQGESKHTEKDLEIYVSILHHLSEESHEKVSILNSGFRVLTYIVLRNPSLHDEYGLICYHSLKHLSEYDDINPDQATHMFSKKERALLQVANQLAHSGIDYIRENLFDESWRAVWARLLDYFDADVVEEVLDTINSLICHKPNARMIFSGSSLVNKILDRIGSDKVGCRKMAIWIMRNLSCNNEFHDELRSMRVFETIQRLQLDVNDPANNLISDFLSNMS
eukprot:TRINITY_DN2996_c1_g1_i1.p1 TRINITY_DN2996_c1_g1~~TRINITY_DN2996_c1_g1_i1.p1  ORF type:complete len:813 (-),score=149.85 TRINITY_DN2996_c1_g1_i1:188-2626(-)